MSDEQIPPLTDDRLSIRRNSILVKPNRIKNPVWNYTSIYNKNDVVDADDVCVCMICYGKYKNDMEKMPVTWEIKYGKGHSTSSILSHFRSHHSELYKEIMGEVIQEKLENKNDDDEDTLLLKWLIFSFKPFNEVEQESFRNYIRYLNPNAHIHSRDTAVAMLRNKYIEVELVIKEMIQDKKVSVTTDTWTSGK